MRHPVSGILVFLSMSNLLDLWISRASLKAGLSTDYADYTDKNTNSERNLFPLKLRLA
jgi:hypothetical protein